MTAVLTCLHWPVGTVGLSILNEARGQYSLAPLLISQSLQYVWVHNARRVVQDPTEDERRHAQIAPAYATSSSTMQSQNTLGTPALTLNV